MNDSYCDELTKLVQTCVNVYIRQALENNMAGATLNRQCHKKRKRWNNTFKSFNTEQTSRSSPKAKTNGILTICDRIVCPVDILRHHILLFDMVKCSLRKFGPVKGRYPMDRMTSELSTKNLSEIQFFSKVIKWMCNSLMM